MSLPAYPEYKESGVERLGQVPSHWAIYPCRYFVEEQRAKNDDAQNNDYLSLMANVGVIPYEEKGDIGNKKPEDLSKCKLVAKGDLVINSMNYGIGSYGLSQLDGVCSPVYIVLRPRLEQIEARYAFRVFENKAFQTYAQSFGNGILEHRAAINWDILKGINVALPPLSEQRIILQFLDRETAKIDALIAEQEKLLTLLAEKREATISQAVTKGLNPDVPMKDSGGPLSEDVPAHWDIRKLKRIISMKSGEGITSDEIEESGEFKVYGGNGCRGYTSTFTHNGDYVLIGRQGALCGNVHHVIGKFWASEHAVVCTVISNDLSRWLYYLLGFMDLGQYSVSAAQPGLSVERIQELYVAVPPLREQSQISKFLDEVLGGIDLFVNRCNKSIELLRERRAALIAAAVTGKIDVRNYHAKETA